MMDPLKSTGNIVTSSFKIIKLNIVGNDLLLSLAYCVSLEGLLGIEIPRGTLKIIKDKHCKGLRL